MLPSMSWYESKLTFLLHIVLITDESLVSCHLPLTQGIPLKVILLALKYGCAQ